MPIPMPPPQQTALVQKYCTVCHTDKSNNGGLTLQHFDAAKAPPSLIAMLLSKMTGGSSLETATLTTDRMKSGAIGAAGLPIPDQPTIDAWIQSFSAEATGAKDWNLATSGDTLSASILREVPRQAGEAREYRLIASCNQTSHAGQFQLAWSPQPQNGALTASTDGKPAASYLIKGSEKMGNSSGVITSGLASADLAQTLPAESLTISGLFPAETVVFPFANLPTKARRGLEPCFPNP